MIYDYTDIELSVVKQLNTRILNKAFTKLHQNDESTVPANSYVPNIWEDTWTGKVDAVGYSKGQCVWSNDGGVLKIYISKKDDNRSLTSDTTAWTSATINSYNDLTGTILRDEQQLLKEHVDKYHFGGFTTVSEYDDVLIQRDMSNFELSNVYDINTVETYEQTIDSTGFDYVISAAKTEENYVIKNSDGSETTYKIYKMFRLWNSGHLEHFGIVPCEVSSEECPLDNNYRQTVKFDWAYQDEDGQSYIAPIYTYENTTSVDEVYHTYYYGDGKTEDVQGSEHLSKFKRYSINLTPIVFDAKIDMDGGKNVDFSQLKSMAYPTTTIADNKNNTYFNYELHHLTNSSFAFTRSNINDTAKDERVYFYAYSASGYRLNNS